MPIPNPKKNEDKNKYMNRCMEFMKDEKYKQKQKIAICLNTFSRPKKKANAEIELDITDTEEYQKYIKLKNKLKSIIN